MDEPSSTLSKREFETLLQLIKDLKAKGITLIYISHHLEELFMVGDRITILRDGKFVACRNASEINEDHLVEYMTGAKVSQKNEYTEAKPLNDEKVLEVKGLTNHKVRNIPSIFIKEKFSDCMVWLVRAEQKLSVRFLEQTHTKKEKSSFMADRYISDIPVRRSQTRSV